MILRSLSLSIITAAATLVSAASAQAGKPDPSRADAPLEPDTCGAFKTDPRVAAHLTVTCSDDHASYWDCRPAGLWATVDSACGEDPITFGRHPACTLAADGIEGRLTPAHTELFALLAVTDGEPWMKCRQGPEHPAGLGMLGLGFMRAKDKAATLVALIEPSRANALGGDGKVLAVQALWRMGARDTDAAMAAVLPTGTGVLGFRAYILQVLSLWGSNAAIPYCMQAIGGQHTETARACASYLADRAHAEAVPLIVRNIDRLEVEGLIALGRLGAGNARAKSVLDEKAESGGNAFIAARIALAELGSTTALKEIQARLASVSDLRGEVLTLAHATGKKVKADIIAWLSREQARLAKEDKLAAARALIVRAQLGDPKAIAQLAEKLDDSDADIRKSALAAIGGAFGTLEQGAGRRIVPDKSLIPALKAFYGVEQDPDLKASAVGAWADLVAATSL